MHIKIYSSSIKIKKLCNFMFNLEELIKKQFYLLSDLYKNMKRMLSVKVKNNINTKMRFRKYSKTLALLSKRARSISHIVSLIFV